MVTFTRPFCKQGQIKQILQRHLVSYIFHGRWMTRLFRKDEVSHTINLSQLDVLDTFIQH